MQTKQKNDKIRRCSAMKIDYTVTEKDFVHFNLYHTKNSKLAKWFILLPFLTALVIITRFIFRDNGFDILHTILFIATSAILMGVLFMLINPLFDWSMKWLVKMELKGGKHNDFIGPQTLTLHDEFLEDGNSHMTSQIKYSSIEKICCDYDCFFIYIGAVKAILVPLTCFTDDAQKQAFLTILKQKTGLDVAYAKRAKK